MSNRIYMITFPKGDLERVFRKANEVLNPEGLTLTKAVLTKHIIEYVKGKDVRFSEKEIDFLVNMKKEEKLIIPRIEPYNTILKDLEHYYNEKYGSYFKFTGKKVGLSNAVRLAFYEFLRLTGEI